MTYLLKKRQKSGAVMGKLLHQFNTYRDRMNQKILDADNTTIKRFYSLDTLTYQRGSLDVRTKEMLGLVSSMVLRCDDCIKYHIIKCRENGVTKDEFFDIFSVATVVGGSIVIPHLRRAVEFLEDLEV
jgi:AhpD family alkylhydroperoxidase